MEDKEKELMDAFNAYDIPLNIKLERLALINRLAGETGKSYTELAKELGIGVIEARAYRTFYYHGKKKLKEGTL